MADWYQIGQGAGFGGLGHAANALDEYYKNYVAQRRAQEQMALQAQQVDYSTNKNFSLSPEDMGFYTQTPDTVYGNALNQSAGLQPQAPKKEFYEKDPKTGKLKKLETSQVEQGIDRAPAASIAPIGIDGKPVQIAGKDSEGHFIDAQGNRIPSIQNNPAVPPALIQQAAAHGFKYNPATNSFVPASGMSALAADLIKSRLGGREQTIGNIYENRARPAPSAPAMYVPPPSRGQGRTPVNPAIKILQDREKALQAALLKPNVSAQLLGMSMSPEQINEELAKVRAQLNQAVGIKDGAQSAGQPSQGATREQRVQKYMQQHKVDRKTAEKVVDSIR